MATVNMNGAYRLVSTMADLGQNPQGNYSTLGYEVKIVNTTPGVWHSGTGTYDITVAGLNYTGSFSYNFNGNAEKVVYANQVTVPHNVDGTAQTWTLSAYVTTSNYLGNATVNDSITPARIYRATQGTLSKYTFEPGEVITINTPRQSPDYLHIVKYIWGGDPVTIQNAVATSTTWTPPMALLNVIPNHTSAGGIIRVETYVGGSTLIGTHDIPFTMTVPASVVPTIGGLTATEATAGVAAGVGRLVQGISTLNVAATAIAPAYSSPIVSRKIEVFGGTPETLRQSLVGDAGVTQVITDSGTVRVRATVTDSRGRVGTREVLFKDATAVLPYLPPQIGGVSVKRATTSAGTTLGDTGTYVRFDLTTAITSLMNGTEKNTGTYKIFRWDVATSAWIQDKTGTRPIGSSTAFLVATTTQATTISRTYRIEITDRFGTTTRAFADVTLASDLLLDLAGADGLGVKKRWAQGALDVGGDIFQNGFGVYDTSDLASTAETTTGTSTVKLATPAGVKGHVDSRLATNAEAITGTLTTKAVTPAGLTAAMAVTTGALTFSTNYGTRTDYQAPVLHKDPKTGLVTMTGVLVNTVQITFAGATAYQVATVPVGFRPPSGKTVFAGVGMSPNMTGNAWVTIDAVGAVRISMQTGATHAANAWFVGFNLSWMTT